MIRRGEDALNIDGVGQQSVNYRELVIDLVVSVSVDYRIANAGRRLEQINDVPVIDW